LQIEYYHASKHGNGIKVAEEFKRLMATKNIGVNIHHVKKVKPEEIQSADLYVFSSPGRFGKPAKEMRKFLEKINLASGTRYVLLTTQMIPKPDKKTGKIPSEEEAGQKIISTMTEILQDKELQKVAEERIFVIGTKGPLEEDWQKKVETFVQSIPVL